MERLTLPVVIRLCSCPESDRNQAQPLGVDLDLNSKRSTVQIRSWRFHVAMIFACMCSLAIMPEAQAAFIGNYSLANSTGTNTNADGCAGTAADALQCITTPNNGNSIVIRGGNNGSDQPGTTDLLFTAAGTGPVQFSYSYSTLDDVDFDYAGYLLGNNFTQLANFNGISGNTSFNVSLGQSFGFRVGTKDNTGEPGFLTISDFSAPSGGGSTVPEPGTAPVLFVAAGLGFAARRRIRHLFCVKV